jgi:hypothetical protein
VIGGNVRRHKTLIVMDYQAIEKRPPTKEERDAKKEQPRIIAEENLRKPHQQGA